MRKKTERKGKERREREGEREKKRRNSFFIGEERPVRGILARQGYIYVTISGVLLFRN